MLLSIVATTLPLLIPGPVQDEPTPEQRFDAIEAEYDQAMSAFWAEYRQQPEAQIGLFFGERPDPEGFVPRFREFAEAVPGTDVAARSLGWIVANSAEDETIDAAVSDLIEAHVDHEIMTEVCMLQERRLAAGPTFLERIVATSTSAEVKGAALYSSGKLSMNQAATARRLAKATPEEFQAYEGRLGAETVAGLVDVGVDEIDKRAEEFFERVVTGFADGEHWRGSLGQAAQGDLFQLRNLALGKVAPDIEGEDIEGTRFKLSDYRGKVVVIDFWGNW